MLPQVQYLPGVRSGLKVGVQVCGLNILGYIGVILELYKGSIGILEKKKESTRMGFYIWSGTVTRTKPGSGLVDTFLEVMEDYIYRGPIGGI